MRHAQLEGEEGDELRQGDDARAAPARVEQAAEPLPVGVARVQHQHVRVLERRREPVAERVGGLHRLHRVLGAGDALGRVLGPEGSVRAAARRALGLGDDERFEPRPVARLAQQRAVERDRLGLPVEARDEQGDRRALGQRHLGGVDGHEERLETALGVLARLGSAIARLIERVARGDAGERGDDVDGRRDRAGFAGCGGGHERVLLLRQISQWPDVSDAPGIASMRRWV